MCNKMYYLSRVCCVCFESREILCSLNNKINQMLVQKFQYCIGDVEPDVPLFICNACCLSLNSAYEFKKSCTMNIARLRSYVSQLVQCKSSTNANVMDKYTVPRKENDRIVYSDVQVNIPRCSPTFNLSFENLEPIIKPVKSEFNPVFDESLNINDENLLSKTKCTVDTNESMEDPLLCSEIIKEEHDITTPVSVNIPIKNEVSCDEEYYLNHSVKEASMMQASPIKDLPTSASLQSTEELDVRQSELESSSNNCVWNAKSEMITESSDTREEFLDVDRGVAAAAYVGDSPCGQRTPQTKSRLQTKSKTIRRVTSHAKEKFDTLFTCDVCSKQFAEKRYLQAHVQSHSDPFYSCTECGKKFTRKKYYNVHIRIHSENRKRYKCTLCPKQYYINTELKYHIRKSHHTECSECNKVFKSNEELCLHSKKEHLKEHLIRPSYKCDICSKHFSRPGVFQAHVLSHRGGTPFKCTHCPEAFKNNNRLKRHMVLEHNIGKTQCENCGKKLDKSMFEAHVKAHEAELPHVCPQCGKKFARKKDFGVHVKKHNVQNCYSCSQCGRVYLQLKTFKDHMLTHS